MPLIATDYIEVYWQTGNTSVSIETLAASGNYPRTPSIIFTATQVMYTQSGYSGISGYSGYSGISGYSGAVGTSGFSGYSGSGFSGYSGSGVSGYSGFSGISGYSGSNGTNGTSGFSGYSGISGYSGATGATGTSGFSGYSGYSGSGVSGFSGYSGTASTNTTALTTTTTTSASTFYLDFAPANGGSAQTIYNNGSLTYVPSTGALSATTMSASSDERLKSNWADLDTDMIDQLAIVKHGTYDHINSTVRQVGASAQDIQKFLPEAVGVKEDGMLSLAYGNAALVACIQLAQRVINLELELKKLNGEK